MSEGYFGRACKTCRRRGRGCDRRLPTCNTCESNGLVCEGYLLQWPGLASRGKFVGKSIPVSTGKGQGGRAGKEGKGGKGVKGAKATKARRSRRTQPTEVEVSTSTPALALAPASQSPPDEAQDNQGDPTQSRMLNAPKFLTKEIPIDPQLAIDDNTFLFDTLMDFQSTVEVETLKMPTLDIGTYMDMNNQLYPRIDVLNIPDELKFIMEYRQYLSYQLEAVADANGPKIFVR
ncbi:hypothetical protein N7494_010328 [Penicillium frequentans]|uniref:Zn(2)-C6 fungal-type domain-containing protein n=1 Tax=Penicillium frequentans TaxID=3151616 RepID=A0AAD6CHI4_9EURO|nr:hypothetical protein N7494_010328 [Penicillium glabrum]